MAFLLKRNSFSHLRSHSQKGDDLLSQSRRGIHVAPGPREQALLAEDPALSRFKSYKKSVKKLKRVGDVLTVVVVAGICYMSKLQCERKLGKNPIKVFDGQTFLHASEVP